MEELEQMEDQQNFPRPLDTLNALRNKEVTVDLRGGDSVTGKLLSFDLTINIGLDVKGRTEFIKGESVISISQPVPN